MYKIAGLEQVGESVFSNKRRIDVFLFLPSSTGPTKVLPVGINHISRGVCVLFPDLNLDFARVKEIVGIQKLNPSSACDSAASVPRRTRTAVFLINNPVRKSPFPQNFFGYVHRAVG